MPNDIPTVISPPTFPGNNYQKIVTTTAVSCKTQCCRLAANISSVQNSLTLQSVFAKSESPSGCHRAANPLS